MSILLSLMPSTFNKVKNLIRSNAPWGLQRVIQSGPTGGSDTTLSHPYSWADGTAGTGVDVYVLDTVSVPTSL